VQELHGVLPHTGVGHEGTLDLHADRGISVGETVDAVACEGDAQQRSTCFVSSNSEKGKLHSTEGHHPVDCCMLPGTISAAGVAHAECGQHQAPQAELLAECAEHSELTHKFMTRMPKKPQVLTADAVFMGKQKDDGFTCLHEEPQVGTLVRKSRRCANKRRAPEPQRNIVHPRLNARVAASKGGGVTKVVPALMP